MGLLFGTRTGHTPFRKDLERLVNKDAIFASFSDDERAQAIDVIERFMDRHFAIGLAAWQEHMDESTSEMQKINRVAIAMKATEAAEQLYGH